MECMTLSRLGVEQGLTSARNPPRLLAYCRIRKRTPPRWYCRRYLLMQAGTVSSSSVPAAKRATLKQAALSWAANCFAARIESPGACLVPTHGRQRQIHNLFEQCIHDLAASADKHTTALPNPLCTILTNSPVSKGATQLLPDNVIASSVTQHTVWQLVDGVQWLVGALNGRIPQIRMYLHAQAEATCSAGNLHLCWASMLALQYVCRPCNGA